MIYNQLQSITRQFTMIYNQLQSITRQFTIKYKTITMSFGHLQLFTINYKANYNKSPDNYSVFWPFTINYNKLPDNYNVFWPFTINYNQLQDNYNVFWLFTISYKAIYNDLQPITTNYKAITMSFSHLKLIER